MTIIFSLSMTLITCFSHYIKVNPDTDMFRICKSFVFYNKSPSIPRGIYLRVPRLWLTSGDYVIYSPPSDVTDIAFNRGWIKSKKITFKQTSICRTCILRSMDCSNSYGSNL